MECLCLIELEKLVYRVLGNISAADTPIVFKGTIITELILAEHRFHEAERITNDIEANWVDTPPSMDVLVDTINRALGDLQSQ